MRHGGQPPCRRVQAIAESKLQQIKQQIKDLCEMRDQLDALLKDWKVKLARTPKGEPARLLDTLPQEFPRIGLRSDFAKKRKGRPDANRVGRNGSLDRRIST
jgi:hypothetical protein